MSRYPTLNHMCASRKSDLAAVQERSQDRHWFEAREFLWWCGQQECWSGHPDTELEVEDRICTKEDGEIQGFLSSSPRERDAAATETVTLEENGETCTLKTVRPHCAPISSRLGCSFWEGKEKLPGTGNLQDSQGPSVGPVLSPSLKRLPEVTM